MAGTRGQIRNLDDPTELAAAHNDPVGFVSANARPLFIDEVQRGGEPLIRAVKAEVDRDPQAGKFVLAGSTRFLSEPTLGESLAGRSAFLEVLPLSEGELRGQGKIFLLTWPLRLPSHCVTWFPPHSNDATTSSCWNVAASQNQP